MTTETSNARGEWVLVPHSPTPEMIEAGILFGTSPNKATIIYQSMVNAAPPPAAARGDVRGLPQPFGYIEPRQDLSGYEVFDEPGPRRAAIWNLHGLQAALAAEGVQAGEVEQRDREADRARFTDPDFNDWLDCGISDCGHTVYDSIGSIADAWQGWHAHVVSVMLDSEPEASADLDAILSQQPEARGVVDEALAHADLCRLSRVFNAHNVPGLDQDRRINEWLGKRIAAALTGERNG